MSRSLDSFSIVEVLGPATPTIRVCAVGAMYIGAEPHDSLITRRLCSIVGFEPIADECKKLNLLRGPTHRYLPYVIGDGTRRTFHRMNFAMTSSLYLPNRALLRQFHSLDELTQVVATEVVQTHRLDDLPEIGDVDFLKIDVQGAAYDVLAGAHALLRRVQVIHTEVEFVPMYLGQRLAGDVDQLVRDHGFSLHKYFEIINGTFRSGPTRDGPDPRGQKLWADVVYTKDFMTLADVEPAKLRALSVILHEVYQAYDFCAYVLHVHDKITGSDYWSPYLEVLSGAKPSRRLQD